MAALLVLLVVAIILLVAVWVVRRRSDDEVHSVEGYRHALTTLEEVRARSGGSVRSIRPAGRRPAGSALDDGAGDPVDGISGAGSGGRSGPVVAASPAVGGLPPTPTPRRIPEPLTAAEFGIEAGEHLVFGDPRADAPDPVPLVVDLETEDGERRQTRRRRRAGRGAVPPPRSSRRVVWVAVVGVVVVLVGGGVYAVTRSHPGRSAAQASGTSGAAHSATSVPKATTPTTSGPTTSSHATKRSTTTTTTVPSVLTPESPTTTAATYAVPAGAYDLTMSVTTGPCWMQVTSASTGRTLFAGTVRPGQQQHVQTTGASSILIGATSASIRVNGTPASLPSGFLTPFTLNLQPS